MSFPVLIRKQIHGSFSSGSSLDVNLQREVELPIPPQPGMTIVTGDEFEAVIIEVSVAISPGDFLIEAWTEPDKEIYRACLRKSSHRPMEEIVAEWVEAGWNVRP